MLKEVLKLLPVGPKHVQQLQNWVPTASLFGAGAGCIGIYFTDWKVITQFIPFYRGKIAEAEE